MRLERDEFVVSFDPSKVTESQLIACVKKSGYTAQVVSGKTAAVSAAPTILPKGSALLDEAMAQAQRENKLLVLDFSAEWCVPCRRMEKTMLLDPRVIELLKQVVFLRLDADQQTELANKLGVVGLPDIRLAAPDGRVLRQLRGYQDADSFAAAIERLVQMIGK